MRQRPQDKDARVLEDMDDAAREPLLDKSSEASGTPRWVWWLVAFLVFVGILYIIALMVIDAILSAASIVGGG